MEKTFDFDHFESRLPWGQVKWSQLNWKRLLEPKTFCPPGLQIWI